MNAWLEWIKYSVCTLNKSYCYTRATGRLELKVVSFPLGWTTDSWYGMHNCPLPRKDNLGQCVL
jgi:hypothetical protein